MVHICNPSPWETKPKGPEIQGQQRTKNKSLYQKQNKMKKTSLIWQLFSQLDEIWLSE